MQLDLSCDFFVFAIKVFEFSLNRDTFPRRLWLVLISSDDNSLGLDDVSGIPYLRTKLEEQTN